MKKISGYTLIEILVALTVFAILASITASVMYRVSMTRTRVNEQADRLTQLQLAISLISNESEQIIERPVYGNDMHLFPAFIGRSQYAEFTRGGLANPAGLDKRSTLKRVALVCAGSRLYRRSWAVLDSPDRNNHQDKLLLDKLTDCHFNFLNHQLQVFNEWRASVVKQNQKKETLPKAIQLDITLSDWGNASFLFTLPQALYNE